MCFSFPTVNLAFVIGNLGRATLHPFHSIVCWGQCMRVCVCVCVYLQERERVVYLCGREVCVCVGEKG